MARVSLAIADLQDELAKVFDPIFEWLGFDQPSVLREWAAVRRRQARATIYLWEHDPPA